MEKLIQSVKESIPEEAGEEAYYLVIAAVIVSSHNPAEIAPFYRYLADHVIEGDSGKAAQVSTQMREALMKAWTLTGIPPVITALSALIKEEDPSFHGASALNEKWANAPNIEHGGPISERGMAMMTRIYGPELLPKILDTFGSFRSDLVFHEASVIYGLYLADHSVLTEIQSSCIIVACMLCTGFGQPSLWHLRGLCRLLGARGNVDVQSQAIVDKVQRLEDAIKDCVRHYRMEDKAKLKDWPSVAEVEKELGGFGNDPL